VLDALFIMWIIGQALSLAVFWLPALYFAWQRNRNGVVIFVVLVGLATLAVYGYPDWPVYANDALWWFVARVVALPVGVALPVVAYRLFRRYVTEAQYPNLAESVRAGVGRLDDSNPVADTVTYAPDTPDEGDFDWTQ